MEKGFGYERYTSQSADKPASERVLRGPGYEEPETSQATLDAVLEENEHIETILKEFTVRGGDDLGRLKRLLDLKEQIEGKTVEQTKKFYRNILKLFIDDLLEQDKNGNQDKIELIQRVREELGANLKHEEIAKSMRQDQQQRMAA